MRKYRALDLFAGAGGVSVGLQRAGFEVTGVDIKPMPRYRGGTFIQANALTFPLDGFDFIWASPPCQAYSALRKRQGDREYSDLVAVVRVSLRGTGAVWAIENVPEAPLRYGIELCGASFGLGALCADGVFRSLRRHRRIEASIWGLAPPPCACHGEALGVYGNGGRWRSSGEGNDRGGYMGSRRERQEAMGIDWMTIAELSQAIPPAYAEWIGRQAMAFLQAELAVTLSCAGGRR